jgi:hypothetical protein
MPIDRREFLRLGLFAVVSAQLTPLKRWSFARHALPHPASPKKVLHQKREEFYGERLMRRKSSVNRGSDRRLSSSGSTFTKVSHPECCS